MATPAPSASPVEWTWPAKQAYPPLELQLLPPSPSPLAAHDGAEESPWGVDPSRLQRLMMGSSAALSTACSLTRPSPDLGALFDDGISLQHPLPSGWERCLDLQSGEVFLKQSCDSPTKALQRPACEEQCKNEKPAETETLLPLDAKQRWDWSLWLQGDSPKGSATVSSRHDVDSDTPVSLNSEPDLCLDLNLRLTNWKRCKSSITSQGTQISQASNCLATNMRSCHGDSGQSWKRKNGPSSKEKPSNIQEMVQEATMVTAVCSKCLMYVLLRKDKPICPRCSVPIILEGASTCSVSRKRPLLGFSSRDLSFLPDSGS